MKPRPKYVRVDDVGRVLHKLAADRFSVVDPTYQAYLAALSDVEDGLSKIHQYEEHEIRQGHWVRDERNTWTWHCSVCGARVYWANRKAPCRYLNCPRCKSQMEVTKGSDR